MKERGLTEMRQFLDRLSYLSFLHVTSGYVLANLFLIQSSKKDFVVAKGPDDQLGRGR